MTRLYHILVENLAEIVTIATSGATIVRYTYTIHSDEVLNVEG